MGKAKRSPNKYYTNGMVVQPHHFREAKEAAIAAGLYSRWGNFGPLHKNRSELSKKPVAVHTSAGYEFYVYEVECMSMGWDFKVSPPRIERWGMFRPARKRSQNC